jgi:hypothetical protein
MKFTCGYCGAEVVPPPGATGPSGNSAPNWWEPEHERPICEGVRAEIVEDED